MSINRFLIFFLLLGVWAVPAWSESLSGDLGESSSDAKSKLEARRSNLEGLREFNEGAAFLLQRYATLEAMVGALQSGRLENQAFAIGAASVVPGAGQMINGSYQLGGLLLFADSVSGISANQLAFAQRKPRHAEWALGYYSAEILRNGVMLYATLHAANASYRMHQNHSAAMWTGAASVVPGVGQAINGNWWEAGGFFAAWAASSALAMDMESRVYGEPDKNLTTVSTPEPSWSVAVLPLGIAVNVAW